MVIPDKLLSVITKVVRIISLKNVAIWTATAVLAIFSYTTFESRSAIVNFIVNGPEQAGPQVATFTMGEVSRARVRNLVNSNELIGATIVLTADIRNNRRVPIFWFSNEQMLQKQLDLLFGQSATGLPLFTSNDKSNDNIVAMINGEFACIDYISAGGTMTFPGLTQKAPYLCRASIPPYYGQFSGYITMILRRQPTASEIDTLKSETIGLSTELYFRDVKRQR